MPLKVLIFFLVFVSCGLATHLELPVRNPGLDQSLFEDVLDEELCLEQLEYIQNNTQLRLQFLDAGFRMPRGIFDGNLVDLGNYYQCLGINEDIGDSVVEGKYCSIHVPFGQDVQLPTLPELPELPEWPEWPELPQWPWGNSSLTMQRMLRYRNIRNSLRPLMGQSRVGGDSAFFDFRMQVAVCLPKSCTTRQAVDALYWNVPSVLEFEDNYCRLPNDKTWVAADYLATIIFSLIGLLTIICTWYDVYHTVLRKRDPKKVNALYKSFSVYTNTTNLVTFSSNPKVIQCLDGIRVIAMMWIIAGHTFSTQTSRHLMNPVHIITWLESFHSIWITASPISVDTFFLLSGLLLVYTTTGKMGSMAFLPRIPMFYLNRLLRMFPMLATVVLLQASWINRVADGPAWDIVLVNTQNCRTYWWATLLHIQNYVSPDNMCLGHTWYLAVDTQLYILSPIIMLCVFYSKRAAWTSITLALVAIVTGATVFNAIWGFRSTLINVALIINSDQDVYMNAYYYNTLTRGAPFFVGMLFGYILYSTKGLQLRLSKPLVALLWLISFAVSSCVIYITYPSQQLDWDQPILDVCINSFMRPVWAACVGWMIFACQHGYGGILNWFLSLNMWKLPSKISYGMYVFHYQLIFMVNSMGLSPFYFMDNVLLFRFFGDLLVAVIAAFLATVLIDAPFTVLINLATGAGAPRPKKLLKEKPVEINPQFDGAVNPAFRFTEFKTKL